MPGTRLRSLVVAVGLACAALAPRVARADDASEKLELDTRRLEAEQLVGAADRKPAGQAAVYASGAEIYEALYQRFCGTSGPAGRYVPNPTTCAELAYNAARAYRAAQQTTKTIALLRLLVAAEDRTHAHTPLAVKAMYQLGGEYQSVALYDQAAEWYERYATHDPKAAQADRALSDAVILRLGLGQAELAEKDAATFVKSYGVNRAAQAATIMFAIAAHHDERGDFDKARTTLTSAQALLAKAPVDVQIQARVLLARTLTHGPTPTLARAEYAKARGFWRDPTAAEGAIRRAHPDEDTAIVDRRLAKTLNAVGEAMFAEAEDRRLAEVESVRFPSYAGAFDEASVKAHVESRVRPWFLKKKTAVEAVEKALVAILDIRPVPPPRWVIAAGATDGLMWGAFADDFRRSPIPDAWKKNAALLKIYTEAIESMIAEIKTRNAKPALMKCVDLSVKYQFFDERSRSCGAWLVKNYKTEFHAVEELVPPLRNAAVGPVIQPFSYGGLDPAPSR